MAGNRTVCFEATTRSWTFTDGYWHGDRDVRRVVVQVQKLDYGDPDNVRLLMTAVDITLARMTEHLKDNQLREKTILLQELQHRVANSLQIIASVLLQNAKQVDSDESRLHLRDAHNR